MIWVERWQGPRLTETYSAFIPVSSTLPYKSQLYSI